MAALAIGSTVAGHAAQKQAAKQQAKYQNSVHSETGRIARENYIQQVSQSNVRMYQEDAAAKQQGLQQAVQSRSAQATTAVGLGEMDMSGNTVDLLLRDFDQLDATNQFAAQTNADWLSQQNVENVKAMQAAASSQIAQTRPAPVQMPSTLATALQIGSTVFAAYDQHNYYQRQGVYDPNNKNAGWMFKPITKT
jgi:hypothetical protein